MLQAVDTSLLVISVFLKSMDARGYMFRFFSERETRRLEPGQLGKDKQEKIQLERVRVGGIE